MTGAARASSTRVRVGAAAALAALCATLAAAAATQLPADARPPSPAKTIPTLPPGSDVPSTVVQPPATGSPTEPSAVESAAPDSSVVSPAGSVATAVETGIPLEADSPASVLLAAAGRALRSNDDIATGLAGFAVIPSGIPTPAGATVDSISIAFWADQEYYVANAELTTTAGADDVAVYYRTVLAAEGFALTTDREEASVHELGFTPTESDADEAAVRVTIDGRDRVAVGIEITDHADAAAVEAFAGWPAGLPGLDDGRPIGAQVSATGADATTVMMSTTFAFEGVTVDELTARIRDGLATDGAGGYSVADDDEGGSTITLDHTVLDDVVVSISDNSGVTELRVDGSFG